MPKQNPPGRIRFRRFKSAWYAVVRRWSPARARSHRMQCQAEDAAPTIVRLLSETQGLLERTRRTLARGS